MSLNYAAALSKYPDKGVLGLKENFETDDEVDKKSKKLAAMISEATNIVFLTGAGISTASGIPDFRGPKGVWTLEEMGLRPDVNIDFQTARPTFTHFAIVEICKMLDKLCYVVSQNVDNLHMRAGLAKDKLSEVHGNIFTEKCPSCGREFERAQPTKSIGMKKTGNLCTARKIRNIKCRGKLVDTVLDWEDPLPFDELAESEWRCSEAGLCLVLGTTLQIQPTGNMPLRTKRNGGKVVIVNLQKTRLDTSADLVINAKCDQVMGVVCKELSLTVDTEPLALLQPGLRMVKKCFRPEPVRYRVKRVKVEEGGNAVETEEAEVE